VLILYKSFIIVNNSLSQVNLRTLNFRTVYLGLFLLILISCNNESSDSNQSTTKTKVVESQAEKSKKDKKVILFYGNSLTAGYRLDESESFPSIIEDKIDSLGLDYTVVNAGLSGETTSGGLKRIEWVMKQQVDIFILELGANDMLRGLPIDQTKENLAAILSIVQKKNPEIKIGLCEMMAAPNMGEKYVKDFKKIYQDLSAPENIEFIPFFLNGVAGNEDLLLEDGKHPNAKGQIIVAKNVWNTLKKML